MNSTRWLIELQPVITQIADYLVRFAAGHEVDDGIPLTWNERDWQIAQTVASIHGLFPLLDERIRSGLLSHGVPHGMRGLLRWQDFLADQHALTHQRNTRILDLFQRAVTRMNAHGVIPMPLKGVDLLTRLYGDIGLRSTSDIDLLLQPDELKRAATAVLEAGFVPYGETSRHAVFVYPPHRIVTLIGEHPDNPIKLEIHTDFTEKLPGRRYEITNQLWHDAQVETWQQVKILRPRLVSLTYLVMFHMMANMMRRSVRFVPVLDLHLLASALTDRDWIIMHQWLASSDSLWWACAPLQMLERYYPGQAPDGLRDATDRAAPRGLRQLASRSSIAEFSCCAIRAGGLRHQLTWARTSRDVLRHCLELLPPSRAVEDAWVFEDRENRRLSEFVHAHVSYLGHLVRCLRPGNCRISAHQLFGSLLDYSSFPQEKIECQLPIEAESV